MLKKTRSKFILSIHYAYAWYEKNLGKLLLLLAVYLLMQKLITLPYLNVLFDFVSFFPYIIVWIVFLILFRPKKHAILSAGFYCIVATALLAILQIKPLLEFLGNAIYFLFATYILYSLAEVLTSKKRI